MAVLVSFRPQCQRHQTILPSGCRAGFFMGDGAGVGKGRQVRSRIMCTDTVYFVHLGLNRSLHVGIFNYFIFLYTLLLLNVVC